jgi:hypothetical protein
LYAGSRPCQEALSSPAPSADYNIKCNRRIIKRDCTAAKV